MRGRKYESAKPILKILQNLKENYQYYIHHVFIIKLLNRTHSGKNKKHLLLVLKTILK
jgi:hypothetical protein